MGGAGCSTPNRRRRRCHLCRLDATPRLEQHPHPFAALQREPVGLRSTHILQPGGWVERSERLGFAPTALQARNHAHRIFKIKLRYI